MKGVITFPRCGISFMVDDSIPVELLPYTKDVEMIRKILMMTNTKEEIIYSLDNILTNLLNSNFSNRANNHYELGRLAIAMDVIAKEYLAELEFDIFIGLVEASKKFLVNCEHYSLLHDNYTFCSRESINILND